MILGGIITVIQILLLSHLYSVSEISLLIDGGYLTLVEAFCLGIGLFL